MWGFLQEEIEEEISDGVITVLERRACHRIVYMIVSMLKCVVRKLLGGKKVNLELLRVLRLVTPLQKPLKNILYVEPYNSRTAFCSIHFIRLIIADV